VVVGFELPGRMGMLVSVVFTPMLVGVNRRVAAVLVFMFVRVFVIVTVGMGMLVRMLGSAVRMFVGVDVGMFVGFTHDDLLEAVANKNY
jgi:hypothetical protein